MMDSRLSANHDLSDRKVELNQKLNEWSCETLSVNALGDGPAGMAFRR
jgi:hypothetical protein